MTYLLFLPELRRYLWCVDGSGRYLTTEHRYRAKRITETAARAEAREVILETGCLVELQPAHRQ